MKRVIFRTRDKSLFHISNGDKVLDYFPSDKLFSAIVNISSLMYSKGEVEELIQKLCNDMNISSMYQGLEIRKKEEYESRRIYLVKKPFMRITTSKGRKQAIEERKLVKKIQYISENVLIDLFDNFKPEEEFFEYDLKEQVLTAGGFSVLHNNEVKELPEKVLKALKEQSLIKRISIPGISNQRHSGCSEDMFYREYLQINHLNCENYTIEPFMYFNIKGKYCEKITPVLRLMCDEGIGGERTYGCGQFENVNIIEDRDLTENGIYYINLSAVYPDDEDLDKLYSYMLDNRKGYVYSGGGTDIRKPFFRLIKEGSIFYKGKPKGYVYSYQMKHLNHPLYIYGKAFLTGFGGEGA